jgi:Tfp pilus assembly protein PilW
MKSDSRPIEQPSCGGFTISEMMVSVGIGMMVLAAVAFMTLYGSRSSAAVANYTDLENRSRYALDVISREIRQGCAVVAFTTNLPVKSITLTNAEQGALVTLSYDANARNLTVQKTGQGNLTVLTECDRWDFGLYQRTPAITSTNVMFYYATNSAGAFDTRLCKLISLSWVCSRHMSSQQLTTESVQAAQIVLRNKQ